MPLRTTWTRTGAKVGDVFRTPEGTRIYDRWYSDAEGLIHIALSEAPYSQRLDHVRAVLVEIFGVQQGNPAKLEADAWEAEAKGWKAIAIREQRNRMELELEITALEEKIAKLP